MPWNGNVVTINMYLSLYPHFWLEMDSDSIKTSSHFMRVLNQKAVMTLWQHENYKLIIRLFHYWAEAHYFDEKVDFIGSVLEQYQFQTTCSSFYKSGLHIKASII
jgi:hypothetical protein